MKKEETAKELNEKCILADSIESASFKEKKVAADIMGKIISGIINISDIHGRFATAMIPMFKNIMDEKNTTSKKIGIKSFSLFTKKYIRSNDIILNTDPDVKETLKDVFIVPIRVDMPLLNGEDECIALSLRDLTAAYEKFDDDIRSMVITGYVDTDKFGIIREDIRTIYDEIRSLEDDLSITFLKEEFRDFFNTENIENNKHKVSIKKVKDIEIWIKDTFKCLDDTYLNCVKIQFLILSSINIADPLNLDGIMDSITIKPEDIRDFAALDPSLYKSKTDLEEDDDF